MTIYVDVSCAVHAKAGLARYAHSLVRAMAPMLGDRLRLFQNSLGRVGPLEGWDTSRVAGVRWGYKPWRTAVWAAQASRWPMDRLLPDAELFHATEHLLPSFRRIPTVMTVHDLIFDRFPRFHKLRNYVYLRSAMPLYCRRAHAIIAISDATRRDLITLYDLDPTKIHVIYEAAAAGFRPQSSTRVATVQERYRLPQRYVLAVGTLEPRKNLSRLIDACGPLIDAGLVDGLVLVGGRGWLYDDFFAHLEASPWRNKVILPGFVAEEDLAAVYAGAAVLAQPSLYEGFGLPVLEAMACGTAVCASQTSSLPEVGGDAALYFDPTNTAQIGETLRRVLADEALRHDLEQRGLARAAQFSWERTARETIELYQQVIAGR